MLQKCNSKKKIKYNELVFLYCILFDTFLGDFETLVIFGIWVLKSL